MALSWSFSTMLEDATLVQLPLSMMSEHTFPLMVLLNEKCSPFAHLDSP